MATVSCRSSRVAAVAPRLLTARQKMRASTRRTRPHISAFLSQPTTDGSQVLTDQLESIRPPPLELSRSILMEGFGWQSWEGNRWWRELRQQVPELAAAGVTHLWLPPPSASVSTQGYLPSQLYDLNSRYGSAQELRQLCKELLAAGIRPVADIVINHRCADEQDERGKWTVYRDKVPHPGKPLSWGRWAITRNDPDFKGEGAPDTGEDYGPAPDIDHTNPEVRDSLVDWLNWLRFDVGFEGWRYDFVKGYGARYVAEYVERTVGRDAFCVGEYFVDLRWANSFLEYNQDEARGRMRDWIHQANTSCCLFDFVTKGQLQEAVKHHEFDRLRDSSGRASGLIGWCPERAVTFVDNHDTGSTQQHWPFPRAFVELGYAYIMTHPGIPCMLHEHMQDGQQKQKLVQLAALRQRAGIRADSKLEILAAERDMYVARCNGQSGKVTIKLGPRYDMGGLLPKESEGWRLVQAGNEYAVWEKVA